MVRQFCQRTFMASDGAVRTSPVRPRPSPALALALAACLGAPLGPSLAADPVDLDRVRASGWLSLQQEQRAFRAQIGPLSPPEAARLRAFEAQEAQDRRALEQQESLWLQTERRRQMALGAGPRPYAPSPALNLRIQRAEAGERLRRDISRSYQGFGRAGR
jgi:hypothetical protein